jgi:hypothetical protein
VAASADGDEGEETNAGADDESDATTAEN